LEAFNAGRTLDDLDGPRTELGNGIAQLFAAVDAVGKEACRGGELARSLEKTA
jgi:hypothetical protein